ncbi:MAG: hypothetical protein MZV64_11540 [Ignavibacteriales bacterium]|nr:hypothetical protein [Ignavibacteriales bacterium]MCK7518302.1 hypothetical protein [Ignavibacteriales bacterium]
MKKAGAKDSNDAGKVRKEDPGAPGRGRRLRGPGGCLSFRGRLSKPSDANLLVITLDTTRADCLGVYGGEGNHTANLDALARKGNCVRELRDARAADAARPRFAIHGPDASGPPGQEQRPLCPGIR